MIFVCTNCNTEETQQKTVYSVKETNLSEVEQEPKQSTFFADETAVVDTSLTQETGGIEKATGQRYYVNWEIDTLGNIQSITPCILKQYDSDKDREIFSDSSRMFDQIEQGDWSCVKPIEELDYLLGANDGEWFRMDVNGDGLPKLVNGWEMTGGIFPNEFW